MDVINFTSESLDKYFDTLEVTGNVTWETTKNLLVISYIESLLENPFTMYYITDKDDRAISEALNCMYGTSCIIKFPKCEGNTPMFVFAEHDYPRITEDDIVRHTEDNLTRWSESQQ